MLTDKQKLKKNVTTASGYDSLKRFLIDTWLRIPAGSN
jgi:hypothetical protein